MVAAAILNYNFVMLDHPRSLFMHIKFPFKFRVDRVRTFRDIAIRKFRKFGLKCLFRPPKIMFLESFDLQTLFFINETLKVRLRTGTLPGNDLRQVVHTHVPLSPSSMIWYRSKGGDAPRLER